MNVGLVADRHELIETDQLNEIAENIEHCPVSAENIQGAMIR